MGMPIAVVGVDPGPDWANNINADMSIIDSHNHTPGQGVQITPAGLNINTDLPMNNNNITGIRTSRYAVQTGTPALASDLTCVYVQGVDLYYIDGAGNNVRITQSGSVSGAAGTITGLPSGTASASYAAGTFTFQSATNTPATMNIGSVVIGQEVASGKNVTIAANAGQASNYNLTLPLALPSAQSGVVSDNSGNLSFLVLNGATYTPSVTPSSNTSAVVAHVCQFMQVGSVVTVSGSITPTITSNNLPTAFSISIPVASAFVSAIQLAGTAVSHDPTVGNQAWDIRGNGPNSAIFSCWSGIVTGLVDVLFTFTYLIV